MTVQYEPFDRVYFFDPENEKKHYGMVLKATKSHVWIEFYNEEDLPNYLKKDLKTKYWFNPLLFKFQKVKVVKLFDFLVTYQPQTKQDKQFIKYYFGFNC